MSTIESLNKKLQTIFTNGRLEVGLEVGSDQGLSPDHYIRIPASFKSKWAYHEMDTPEYQPEAGDSVDSLIGKAGWKIVNPGDKLIRIHKGEYYAVTAKGDSPERVGSFHRSPFTVTSIKQFLSVNSGHVRDTELSLEQVAWVHAARFWAVVSGFVCGSKQTEWVEVPDASDTTGVTDDQARAVIERGGVSVTASAARAASWRKSNHATGGDIASGFARRWIAKNAVWPNPADIAARRREQRQATDAFYVATHASCVHPVLAMMAPQVEEHWALINPMYGMYMSWDVLESTAIRIAPNTQVAGTAIVVDSLVVLKMLASEGLAPLLESAPKVAALASAYRLVERNGIRVASYAGWFLEGHPDRLTRVPFAQKDSSFSDLVGELAAVGRTFYRNSTIGESLALENAMQQLATETAKNRWSALTKARKSSTDETVMLAYQRISGAAAGAALQALVSGNAEEVRQGVASYNNVTQNIATAIGIDDPTQISVDRILANMAITPGSSTA